MNLLDLPTDIRKRIWRLLLTRTCPINFELEGSRSIYRKYCKPFVCSYLYNWADYLNSERWVCCSPKLRVDILQVCRRIYYEASEILYTENKFFINSWQTEWVLPVNLRRLLFLHMHVPDIKSQDILVKYQKMIEQTTLNPKAWFVFTSSFTNKDTIHELAKSVTTLGPVQSCSLRLGPSLMAKQVALEIMPKPPFEPTFTGYSGLPKELQLLILSYTNLARVHLVLDGDSSSNLGCCMQCCNIFTLCCCNSNEAFSSTCQCPYSKLPFYLVSREFRKDAMEITYKKGLFVFKGKINRTLSFLQKMEPVLTSLERIVLDLDERSVDQWDRGKFDWDRFIIYCKTNLNLPLLSLTILGSVTIYDEEGLSNEEIAAFVGYIGTVRDFYQSILPGLKTLARSGLRHIAFQFTQHQLQVFEDQFGREVMGQDYVNRAPRLDVDEIYGPPTDNIWDDASLDWDD